METVGDNGGRIQLSAAENVSLASRASARARECGGWLWRHRVPRDGGPERGGVVNVGAGSLIDVGGAGEGGRTVRLRAPQVGNDVAIAPVAELEYRRSFGDRGRISRRFTTHVQTIDQNVIDAVSADARRASCPTQRRSARVSAAVSPSRRASELRSDDDMELTTDWDLHNLRFANGSAGVLALRRAAISKINANLSDGFDGATADAALLGGSSLSAQSPGRRECGGAPTRSLCCRPASLPAGKGSVIVGGTAGSIQYFYDPAHGNEHPAVSTRR